MAYFYIGKKYCPECPPIIYFRMHSQHERTTVWTSWWKLGLPRFCPVVVLSSWRAFFGDIIFFQFCALLKVTSVVAVVTGNEDQYYTCIMQLL